MLSKLTPDLLEEANKFIFVKRYLKAEQILKKMLSSSQFDENLLVHLRYIELGARLAKLDQIAREYDLKLQRDPDSVVYRLGRLFCEQLGDLNPMETIVEGFQEILHQHGDHAAAYYGIGFSMEMLGNFERALYNYTKSYEIDGAFYPSAFGLSQVYYHKGDDKTADHYFLQFENAAPYNVYGNFETHRKLCFEFLGKEMYEEASAAISSLAEWWEEAKGNVPLEIKIYEAFCLAKVYEQQDDRNQEDYFFEKAVQFVYQAMESNSMAENALFFIAKSLEDFGQLELAEEVYRCVVRKAGGSVDMIQKIGSQFLVTGQFALAKSLFEEAYKLHPDNLEIRFCKLVANLKVANVDVEEYLAEKERLKKMIGSGLEPHILIQDYLLLLAQYGYDPDVHGDLGNLYFKAGQLDKAKHHFEIMYQQDKLSSISCLRFAAFAIQIGNIQKAKAAIASLKPESFRTVQDLAEYFWIRTSYCSLIEDYPSAIKSLNEGLALEPWNVSFLLQQGLNLVKSLSMPDQRQYLDPTFEKLLRNEEDGIDWEPYDLATRRAEEEHLYELAYLRQKLKFIYSEGDVNALEKLMELGGKFNIQTCTKDFVRLLNTNFDRPEMYWVLGSLYKDMWQLETASIWLENILGHPLLNDAIKAKVYLDLADCYIWRGVQLDKAGEFARMALDLGVKDTHRAFIILAHGLLKSGQIREAQVYLEHDQIRSDVETVYLRGLMLYRNGRFTEANKLWKPLISMRTENLRFHTIKQEILKYYYEREPYLKAN
jgi:tetratricopeptide (TPR) repeat protein